MDYLESIAYIESLFPTNSSPSLERMQAFMDDCDNLQNSYASIHVAGTNGKGSTVAIIDSILRSAHLKVGRYTGPHLLRINERFHLNGNPISDSEFAELTTRVRKMAESFAKKYPRFGLLTWFELLTAISFIYFAESRVDVAVVEVGLGGRWDATNVLKSPCATVITNIDFDHMHLLGKTLHEIAKEKAGIIKPGVPLVTACTGVALDEISNICSSLNAPLYVCKSPDTILTPNGSHSFNWLSHFQNQVALIGKHQILNALVACTVSEVSNLVFPDDCFTEGLKNVYWPGRFQYWPHNKLILDGAHNPAGAKILREALDDLFQGETCHFVLGCFENKDVRGIFKNLVRSNDVVYACESKSTRSTFSKDDFLRLSNEMGVECVAFDNVTEALQGALNMRQNHQAIVLTGSLSVVADGMRALGWKSVEEGVELADVLSTRTGIPRSSIIRN